MNMQYTAKIAGTGMYAPKRIVNNFDLEKMVDTSDEWIRTRTGMFERHFVADDEAASDLATHAAHKALEAAKLRVRDIDLIIVGSVTSDHAFPSTACIVQKNLGAKSCMAFDVSAGCSGFLYASDIARQFIENGSVEHALVIGVEVLSRFTNWEDRGTCVLFGDGSGAAMISRAKSTDIGRIIDTHMEADGTYGNLLIQPAGGSRLPATDETVREHKHTVHMEGNRIFKLAVKSMYNQCETVLKRNNWDVKSIDWLISHQANLRIIESLGNKLKIDPKKVIINIEKYANTSAASIPIALDEAVRAGKIRRGDVVLMTAFGAGLTSGAMLIRF
ncbi:MAG: ketoacyl-ACP synthase III [Candidatus Cloacimonetes bacterium]|nr:ketoacyl-ACP synthase III [Candidatus Cloacimonadota bacterium]